MFRTLAAAGVIAATSFSFVTIAQAEDFPAAPMNPGPMRMNGMGPVGDAMNLGMMPMNMVVGPVAGMGTTAAAEPAPAPMMKKHHRYMKHKMMKKM